jgi:hypothetical protein
LGKSFACHQQQKRPYQQKLLHLGKDMIMNLAAKVRNKYWKNSNKFDFSLGLHYLCRIKVHRFSQAGETISRPISYCTYRPNTSPAGSAAYPA